jgi:uncharacterized protein YvpB
MPKVVKIIFSALLLIVVGFIITSQSVLILNLIQPIQVFFQPTATQTTTPEIIYVTITSTPFQPVTNTSTHTITPSPTSTWTPTMTSTHTATFPPSNTPIPYIAPTLSEYESYESGDSSGDSYRIWDISGHAQYMPLSCEASASVDWANYFGVSINEYDFQAAYPITDNPDTGFVGDVNGVWGQIPPNSYGVHSEPVAAVLRSYGLSANGHRWMSLDDLKSEIRNGDPVIVWVVGNVWSGTPVSYTDSSGNTTTVARYEHVVNVIGYTADTITVLNDGGVYTYSTDVFMSSWSVLEYQGITN